MALSDALAEVRYITNQTGQKTGVLLSWEAWNVLLQALQALSEQAENQEDASIIQQWLATRSSGKANTISLADLEAELLENDPISC